MHKLSRLVKPLTLFISRTAAFSSFVGMLERADASGPDLLRVLTYHRVDEPDARPALFAGLISATPASFDEQMRYLAANCHVVSMPEVLDRWQSGGRVPPRTVLITFDDATYDFAQHAWPIMKRYGLPATVFVPTAYPDQPSRTFWWDRLHQALRSATHTPFVDTPLGCLPLTTAAQRAHTYKQLDRHIERLPHDQALALVDRICTELDAPPTEHAVLGWSALRELALEGVTLGAHTRTHPLLHRIPYAEARDEVVGSLHDLEREIGSALPIVAYPGGGVSDELVAALRREGFVLGFTTTRGINDRRNADRLCLRRINVGRRSSVALLRAQLLSRSVHLNHVWSLAVDHDVQPTFNTI